ncbi:helix-turn-helix domain-containing protein [Acidothermaceae bacterium B102]|nr:helix-turn-helix domain-containing protein [Acidothermaceae bacterium B102]
MVTVDDLAQALGGLARLVVPPARAGMLVTGIAAWEPGRRYPDGTVLLGVGVAGRPLFEEQCLGVILRDPENEETALAWQLSARERGIGLVLVDLSASWTSVIVAITDLPRAADETAERLPSMGDIPIGDLFALADAFAGMVGGPIIIEDADFRVLAYSTFSGSIDEGRTIAILGRQIPAMWRSFLERSGNLERLRTTDAVVDLDSGPSLAHRRLITAVRSQGYVLGILWAAEGDSPLPPQASASLSRAAQIAVPHLQRHREGRWAERARRGDLVRSLLDGRGQLHRQALELGLPRDASLAVLAFAPISEDTLPAEEWERITDHVAVSFEAFRWHAAVARLGEFVLAIVVVPDARAEGGALRLGSDIVSRSHPALRDAGLCGAVSTVGAGLVRLKQRRLEAQDATLYVRSRPGPERFVSFEAVQPHVVLQELRQSWIGREDLRLPGLARLEAADELRQRDYIATLRVYLRCGGQLAVAARQLGIHATTLRYRLDRMTVISGLDLLDPDVRLLCQMLIDPPYGPSR